MRFEIERGSFETGGRHDKTLVDLRGRTTTRVSVEFLLSPWMICAVVVSSSCLPSSLFGSMSFSLGSSVLWIHIPERSGPLFLRVKGPLTLYCFFLHSTARSSHDFVRHFLPHNFCDQKSTLQERKHLQRGQSMHHNQNRQARPTYIPREALVRVSVCAICNKTVNDDELKQP